MPHDSVHVASVPLPADSAVVGVYSPPNFADAYEIALPPGASTDPERLARFIFSQHSPWAAALMRLRDALVAGLGLKTAHSLANGTADRTQRVGMFKIYSIAPNEIVMGEDDKHLDFRLSLLCPASPAQSERKVVLSTVVRCHNLLGRTYIRLIAPFHRIIVRSSLRRAARAGWPAA
ncbi:MAG TPA: DUF2867 domain-containing protein [Luteimonas sp.]|nr:DUF2867 domain-containing protein [Luteimonas sp.]